MAREDIDLRSHVNSEMDEELSKAFVNFLIGTSGLVVCKNKFFKSCSKEVKERNQIIENLFGFSTPLTIEEAVAKTRSNIRILTEFTKKISTKYGSYITNFESKINDMSKFYFDRKDLIDSETEGYKQNCDNLEKNLQEYRGLKKRIKEANTPITYGEVMKFIGSENNLSILTKKLDKTLKRECRGKINDDIFKKEYALFLLDTFGLAVLKTNFFSSLNSLKKKRAFIVNNINKYILSNSIPEPVWNELMENKKKLKEASEKINNELIEKNGEILKYLAPSSQCSDLRERCQEFDNLLDKLEELSGISSDDDTLSSTTNTISDTDDTETSSTVNDVQFTPEDIEFLRNFDNLFTKNLGWLISYSKDFRERCVHDQQDRSQSGYYKPTDV